MKNIFNFKYFYTIQLKIINSLDNNDSRLMISAPKLTGIKSAIIQHCVSSNKKCIIFIRSLNEIDAINFKFSHIGLRCCLLSSKLSENTKNNFLTEFLTSDKYQFLVCTPDQVKLLRTHSHLFDMKNELIMVLFDCHRALTESFLHHSSYIEAMKFMNGLQTQNTQQNISCVFVSDSLTEDDFHYFRTVDGPPATYFVAQRSFGTSSISVLHCKNPVNNLASLLSNSPLIEPLVIIATHAYQLESILNVITKSGLTITNDKINYQFKIHINNKIVYATDSFTAAVNIKPKHVIFAGLPYNFSFLTPFLDLGSKVTIVCPYNNHSDLSNSLEFSIPDVPKSLAIIDYLFEQPPHSVFELEDLKLHFSKTTSHSLTSKFVYFGINHQYLLLKSSTRKPIRFELNPLISKSFFIDYTLTMHRRALQKAKDVLKLVQSKKCCQEAFNEFFILQKNDAIRCGQCDVCMGESKRILRPENGLDVVQANQLRAELMTFRQNLTTDLPIKALLPDSSIEQIIESLPLSLIDLNQLPSFQNNNRCELFGLDIIQLVSWFIINNPQKGS